MRQDPIWAVLKRRGQPLSWLASRLGYTHAYVRGVASGRTPVTDEFRRRAVVALDLPEEALFLAARDVAEEVTV